MILTPVAENALSEVLDRFARSLVAAPARRVFARLSRSADAARASGALAMRHRQQAIALATVLGMAARPGSPTLDFSWSGEHLRADTEAYVLLHEVAHYQLAAPARRRIVDFGL